MLTRASSRLAQRLLVAAAVGLCAVLARNLGFSPLLPGLWDNAYNLTEFLVIAACALRLLSLTGAERAAWAILLVGLLGYALADVYYTVAMQELAAPPFPSPADAGYLSIYPTAFVALALLIRARAGKVGVGLWLDGLVCALAVAAVGAAAVLGVVASTDGSFATVATNLAYPLGDLTLLAFVIVVLTITGRRAGSMWLLLALAFGVWAIADTIYLYQTAVGTYRDFTILDTAWPAAYVLIGFAATREPRKVDARRLRGRLLVLPASATLLALGLLVVDHYDRINGVALWLACAGVAAAVVRFALTFRENLRMLGVSELEATTDPLTGLGNRRAMIRDLDHAAADASLDHPVLLALFDLDGFKTYNDTFGHPAGDALLARLGRSLTAEVGARAGVYRMGGDEFCLLASGPGLDRPQLVAAAVAALSESGPRFEIHCSHGTVLMPVEGEDPVSALRLADQRMYANKGGALRGSGETIHQVLLRVAAEHDGDLREHVEDVAYLAEAVGRELGLDDAALIALRRASALHDIGKVAIPDAILHAPRALTDAEWQYMRQHTIIGARIIAAAPEMREVADIVRASHERFDGDGYPDRLAGEEIPLAARIVTVCDAFDAIVSRRAYRAARPASEALAELWRCAGTQFDPRIVVAFASVMARSGHEEGHHHPRRAAEPGVLATRP